MAKDFEELKAQMEKAYPGYKFLDAEVKYNGYNAAFYMYLFFMREAMIFENSKTDEGREYLRNCWRMEQTKPDREGVRKNFRKKGG